MLLVLASWQQLQRHVAYAAITRQPDDGNLTNDSAYSIEQR